ncbi:unnamed protein product [Soboliphyme baturini]|uniref:Calponin-homology (CH) domain-containing protein n=1 Tax=Soboliphyme baturini TaxID=241478 RepID=A0A183IX60_9BILA|nr:unnamed protein product [Soboliphyme baturini]
MDLTMLVVKKRDDQLQTRYVTEEITTVQEEFGLRSERDAFDTLKGLFLSPFALQVTDFDTQFQDGVFLVILMGLLERYFVPLHSFYLTPSTFEEKVHNVALCFSLMEEAGVSLPKSRPEDIVNGDIKCTLRAFIALYFRRRTPTGRPSIYLLIHHISSSIVISPAFPVRLCVRLVAFLFGPFIPPPQIYARTRTSTLEVDHLTLAVKFDVTMTTGPSQPRCSMALQVSFSSTSFSLCYPRCSFLLRLVSFGNLSLCFFCCSCPWLSNSLLLHVFSVYVHFPLAFVFASVVC